MRTDDEVVAEIRRAGSSDIFEFYTSDLMRTLSFEAARPFLKDGATAEELGEPESREHNAVRDRMKDYMPFAWDKANSRRGLSAMRSLDHMKAWLWLLGDDKNLDRMNNYTHYGKPQLRAICQDYGWSWSGWDDGAWSNNSEDDGVPASEVPEI